ncbi:MAG: S8 family serine peptidase, partial [Lachnospiraceae bacterium]|nr:S8 family serine peptidase [Lachnospiraceae bacterium]
MRKITAGLLCFVLTFGLCTVSFAGEQGINAPDADSLIRNNEICMTLESTVSELSSLEAGVDYVDGEGVFIADTKEEAEKVAAEYGATLKKYAHRVATISFGDSSIAAFGRAALSPVSKAVDPNYICHLSDVEEIPDIEETEEISPSVNRMEVKGTAPNDKYASSSEEDYQYFHEKINTLTAHDITTGSGVKIAVVDTGCTPDHEDSKFDAEHALAISGISSPADTAVGHGVHCTGIIHETKNNSLGGYGVAPGAEVYSIKIADSDRFDTSVVVEGMAIAIEKGVNVISMSLGGGHMESMKQLAEEAYERGITIVAAAGNECTSSTAAAFPAAYDTVISVAATDSSDALAEYSNYGDWVDIAAPGSDITSTYLHGSKNTISSGGTNDTAYGRLSGTSMACPAVAGVVALMY